MEENEGGDVERESSSLAGSCSYGSQKKPLKVVMVGTLRVLVQEKKLTWQRECP